MKIELKKISFNERMSQETNCFIADLYINGKKVGYAKNEGHGGCTDYRGDSKEGNVLIAEAEKYFLSLPKVKPNGYNFMLQPTLEGAIDEQLEDFLKAKAQKKMEKQMLTAILFGVPNGYSYTMIKYSSPLASMTTIGLQTRVNDAIRKYCIGGVVILNTNLKELGVTV